MISSPVHGRTMHPIGRDSWQNERKVMGGKREEKKKEGGKKRGEKKREEDGKKMSSSTTQGQLESWSKN